MRTGKTYIDLLRSAFLQGHADKINHLLSPSHFLFQGIKFRARKSSK